MALNAEEILSHAGSPKLHEVHVPAWANDQGDDVVMVRALTPREFDTHQDDVERDPAKRKNATAQLLSRVMVDTNGVRLFRTPQQVQQVGDLGLGELQRISKIVMDISGLTKEGQEALEGNSEAGGTGSSSSD